MAQSWRTEGRQRRRGEEGLDDIMITIATGLKTRPHRRKQPKHPPATTMGNSDVGCDNAVAKPLRLYPNAPERAYVSPERARTRIRITRTQSERSAFANARSRTRVSRTRVSRTHERTRTRVRTQLIICICICMYVYMYMYMYMYVYMYMYM